MTKRYKVVGVFPHAGHKPGEVFDAELTPDEELRLTKAGILEVVPRTPTRASSRSRPRRRTHTRRTTKPAS